MDKQRSSSFYSQVFLAGEKMYRSSSGARVGRGHDPVICSSRESARGPGNMFGQMVLLRHDDGGMEDTVTEGFVVWYTRRQTAEEKA